MTSLVTTTVADKYVDSPCVIAVGAGNDYCSGVYEVLLVTTLTPPGDESIEATDRARVGKGVVNCKLGVTCTGADIPFLSFCGMIDRNCILFPVPIGNKPEPCVLGLS